MKMAIILCWVMKGDRGTREGWVGHESEGTMKHRRSTCLMWHLLPTMSSFEAEVVHRVCLAAGEKEHRVGMSAQAGVHGAGCSRSCVP